MVVNNVSRGSCFNRDQGLDEYSLCLENNNLLAGLIRSEQQEFYNQYGAKLPPEGSRIQLASFLASEPMEETVIKWMRRIFIEQTDFAVTLNNYSGIPCHTIYLRIQDQQVFNRLANALSVLDPFLESCSCPPVKIIRPMLPVATGLQADLYAYALKEYARKTFHQSFAATGFMLVKRTNAASNEKTVNIFKLLPRAEVA